MMREESRGKRFGKGHPDRMMGKVLRFITGAPAALAVVTFTLALRPPSHLWPSEQIRGFP